MQIRIKTRIERLPAGSMHKGLPAEADIAEAIKGAGDIAAALSDAAGYLMAEKVKTEEIFEAVSGVVEDAIHAAAAAGRDLGLAAKGTVIGIIRGCHKTTGEVFELVAWAAREMVRNTAEVGGDAALAAKGSVQGAIEGAKEIGLNPEDSALKAVMGALKAADALGPETEGKIRAAAGGMISGIRVLF